MSNSKRTIEQVMAEMAIEPRLEECMADVSISSSSASDSSTPSSLTSGNTSERSCLDGSPVKRHRSTYTPMDCTYIPRPLRVAQSIYRPYVQRVRTRYLHQACRHDFAVQFAQVGLSSTGDHFPTDDHFVKLVPEPRWCETCIKERSQSIRNNHAERPWGYFPGNSLQAARENGVIEGRVDALSAPVEEGELLEAIFGPFDGLKMSTGDAEKDAEICHENGYLQGRTVQARMEEKALLEMDEETREDDLMMALCVIWYPRMTGLGFEDVVYQ